MSRFDTTRHATPSPEAGPKYVNASCSKSERTDYKGSFVTTGMWQKLASFWKFGFANSANFFPRFFYGIPQAPRWQVCGNLHLPLHWATFQQDLKIQISKNLPILQNFSVVKKHGVYQVGHNILLWRRREHGVFFQVWKSVMAGPGRQCLEQSLCVQKREHASEQAVTREQPARA